MMAPMDIQWEEPPEYAQVIGSGQQPGKHLQFALALREHPGRWAVLPDGDVKTEKSAQAKAQNIRRGKVKGFSPAGSYDAAVHETTIWVRYREDAAATPQAEEEQAEVDAATVRAWAKSEGMDVPERGRLPEHYFEKYAAALERGESGLGLRAVREDGA